MSETPQISVIIPCFNYGRFLAESLPSVSAQTLKPIETLIIDDGSTDPKTLQLLDNVSDPGIKVIHQENLGLAGARNSGMRHALGDYIYFLDADDVLFPNCLATLAGMLHADRLAVAACSGVKLLGGKRHGAEWHASCDPYLLLVNNTWAAGLMLRRRAIEDLSLTYDESMRHGYEDWEFNIRLVQTGRKIAVYPEALYYYRIHRNSMLNAARNRHAELVSYIRNKHRALFTADNLMATKHQHHPALAIHRENADYATCDQWLTRQSFKDYVDANGDALTANCPYRMIHAGADAIRRLPPEALECAIVFLESNSDSSYCVLAVRLDSSGIIPDKGYEDESCQPVAIVFRARSVLSTKIAQCLNECEYLIRFSDQALGSQAGWAPINNHLGSRRKWNFRDPVALRKQISAYGEKLLGVRAKQWFVKAYDFVYYRLLYSQSAAFGRRVLEKLIGERREAAFTRLIYGAFLAKPPPKDQQAGPILVGSHDLKPSPLFLYPGESQQGKITILIVTAWLNQGGVEREIFDLCRHLDRSRFRILLATTRRSRHSMERVLRECQVAIYHLAELLPPQFIRNGLAHLVLQHGVDIMHVVHSREAYESMAFIKEVCPFLSISDRNVTVAGGFPKVSAKIGKGLIDVRTVGHHKLARQMSRLYGIALQNLTVIYAGTDKPNLQRAHATRGQNLHELCNLPREIPIVLFVGRLDPEKRPQIFVRVAAKIRKLRPDCSAHFAILGDGIMRGKLKAMIAELGLRDRCHLLGFQRNGLDLIAASTLLMITSAYEGLALVSFEAMAVGTPQISADVGGQSELITSEIGVLIKNGLGESTRYARACVELLYDSDRRVQMSVAAKAKFSAQFSTEHCADEYRKIFEQLGKLTRDRDCHLPSLRPPHIDPLRIFSKPTGM